MILTINSVVVICDRHPKYHLSILLPSNISNNEADTESEIPIMHAHHIENKTILYTLYWNNNAISIIINIRYRGNVFPEKRIPTTYPINTITDIPITFPFFLG